MLLDPALTRRHISQRRFSWSRGTLLPAAASWKKAQAGAFLGDFLHIPVLGRPSFPWLPAERTEAASASPSSVCLVGRIDSRKVSHFCLLHSIASVEATGNPSHVGLIYASHGSGSSSAGRQVGFFNGLRFSRIGAPRR